LSYSCVVFDYFRTSTLISNMETDVER
jgi:hypothetical protein